MGDINIVKEVLDMQDRQNFNDTDLAAIAGTSKTTVGKWFKGTQSKMNIWLIYQMKSMIQGSR
ncbi:hypothetical protein CPR19081_DFPECDIO_01054 [Companilactobacillus paralimentarius]|uniref:hypothetical protein n=1 Tax=Companilactobacillus paralimentarius TaxID=83526 RepID=UPI00384F40DE